MNNYFRITVSVYKQKDSNESDVVTYNILSCFGMDKQLCIEKSKSIFDDIVQEKFSFDIKPPEHLTVNLEKYSKFGEKLSTERLFIYFPIKELKDSYFPKKLFSFNTIYNC